MMKLEKWATNIEVKLVFFVIVAVVIWYVLKRNKSPEAKAAVGTAAAVAGALPVL